MMHKIVFVLVAIFFLILLSPFIFESSITYNKIRFRLTGFFVLENTETNFTSAVIKLIDGRSEMMIRNDENTCFWITPTKENGYNLEVKKYNSNETNGCYGEIVEESKIPTGEPIDIISKTNCLCGKEIMIRRLDEKTGTFFKIIGG